LLENLVFSSHNLHLFLILLGFFFKLLFCYEILVIKVKSHVSLK
jgi:hypothetical protein